MCIHFSASDCALQMTDVTDGDVTDGDVTDGDVTEGDVTDGDVVCNENERLINGLTSTTVQCGSDGSMTLPTLCNSMYYTC